SSSTSTAAASASAPSTNPPPETAASSSPRSSRLSSSPRLTDWLQRTGSQPRLTNRLPAAIDDGYAALKWLQAQAAEPDNWLSEVADFGKVFVVGESAGANIAHHLAVRVGAGSVDLGPVKMKGYVLLYPFFGGVVRTKSEAEAPKDMPLNLDSIDWFFRHSVPVGETSDYPVVNPFGPESKDLAPVELDPMLVVAGGSDVLVDRIRHYVEKLKLMGKTIQYAEFEGQHHAFLTAAPDSDAAKSVMELIKEFVTENSK
ncbi:Probable carboxylesterase 15, partial [Linum perenne]